MLSILIPNLHSPRIGDTVHAVLNQRGVEESYEIVVVGRDRYGRTPVHPQVRFIETATNLNPAAARNLAVAESRGDTLLFLDADCVAEPDWMVHHLAARKAGHEVVGGALLFDRDGYWAVADNISSIHGFLPSTPAGPPAGFHLSCASLCLDKSLYEAVGGLNEALVCGEDFDLMMRLAERGCKMYFTPAARATHRHNRSTLPGLVAHAWSWGVYSIRVRHNHRKALSTPWPLGGPLRLLLLAPLIALVATLRIWIKHPELLRHLHVLPAVLLAKLVWCGAAVWGLIKPLPLYRS